MFLNLKSLFGISAFLEKYTLEDNKSDGTERVMDDVIRKVVNVEYAPRTTGVPGCCFMSLY